MTWKTASVAWLACALFLASPGLAAVITVDGFDSTVADDGVCTLREAIASANTDTASGITPGECPAGSGADSVVLTGDVTLSVVDNVEFGGNGLPLITTDVTIDGAGFTLTRAGGAPDFRFLKVESSGVLTLEDAIVTNGYGASGGAIFNDSGAVTVARSRLSGNTAGQGGAISNVGAGPVTVVDSTLSSNTATFITGGGAINQNSGCVTILRSTLSGNVAPFGGGAITNFFGLDSESDANGGGGGTCPELFTITITNSTISGNSTTSPFTGAVLDLNTFTTGLAITHSTIHGNSGGGIRADATDTLTHSIVANNTGGNCLGTLTDGGNNFDDDGTCPVVGTITGLDPVLADNGGPTQTHALLAGSAAIDAAGACGQATDQRGQARPEGSACDSGAFEFACGNGVVDLGERCDDGPSNGTGGSCCTVNCQFQPLGTVCDTDHNACTSEACIGGICFDLGCAPDGTGCGVICSNQLECQNCVCVMP